MSKNAEIGINKRLFLYKSMINSPKTIKNGQYFKDNKKSNIGIRIR